MDNVRVKKKRLRNPKPLNRPLVPGSNTGSRSKNLACALDIVYQTSSIYLQDTVSLDHFLKQGYKTDFQALKMTHLALTVPNTRACFKRRGGVKKQPGISRTPSGSKHRLSVLLYK